MTLYASESACVYWQYVCYYEQFRSEIGTDITSLRLDASNSQSTFFLFNFIRVFSVDVLQHVNERNEFIILNDTYRSLNLRL